MKNRGGRLGTALVSLSTLGLAAALAGPAAATVAPPTTPSDLFNGSAYCSTDPAAPAYVSVNDLQGLTMQARSQAPADSLVDLDFQVWPAADPTGVVTVSRTGVVPGYEAASAVPASAVVDGWLYAWQARATGAGGASPWSATCYVAIDRTRPAEPTISSANYPAAWNRDQGGAPIQVVFGPGGSGDVAGYSFSWTGDPGVIGLVDVGPYNVPKPENPWSTLPGTVSSGAGGSVQAGPDGSAAVGLIPPADDGYLRLTVESYDRAFNPSPPTTYTIVLKPDSPTVTLQGDKPKYGVQTPYLLTADPGLAAVGPVTGFRVVESDENGHQTTVVVPAAPDGTATLHVTDDSPTGMVFEVRSISADGWLSQPRGYGVDNFPTISSDVYPGGSSGGGAGVPGTFTFSSPVKGVVSFSYTVNGGPVTTVHAANGRAQITFTPPTSDWYDIEVTANTKDGTQLYPSDYYFGVN